MIRELDDGTFVCSSRGTWVVGVYESKRAANYAFRFSDSDLYTIQEQKNKTTKVITFRDLQEFRKTLN